MLALDTCVLPLKSRFPDSILPPEKLVVIYTSLMDNLTVALQMCDTVDTNRQRPMCTYGMPATYPPYLVKPQK